MAGHRDDGTFAEDRAHHPNRKVGRDKTAGAVCTFCSGDSTEMLIPVERLGGGQYLQGKCSNCGEHRVLFKTDPATGKAITKDQLRKAKQNDFIGPHSNENDETLDPWNQEDIDEQRRFRDEANKRGHL